MIAASIHELELSETTSSEDDPSGRARPTFPSASVQSIHE
jgi:hypothetical protein